MNYTMLLQDAPPNTSGYMIAGYVIFVVIMAIYLVSFMARMRNLEQDLSTLRTIEAENKTQARELAQRQSRPLKAAPAKKSSRRRSAPKKRPARRGR